MSAEGFSEIVVHTQPHWLTAKEQERLADWTSQLQWQLPAYTMLWGLVHLASIVLGRVFATGKSSISAKDKRSWHNKVVSTVHAAVACGNGIYWLTASGELAQLEGRAFIFLPLNARLAAIGAAYFIYDAIAMLVLCARKNSTYFVAIMCHHVVFIAAYCSTLVYPCAMSVSVYHYFQLTEFSTIFLHLNWMFSKAQVPYRWVQSMSNLLIVTFAQRVAVSAFIVMHTALKLHELKLWQIHLPRGKSWYTWPYMLYMMGGSIGMLALNASWWAQLYAKKRQVDRNIKQGLPPTPDYTHQQKAA